MRVPEHALLLISDEPDIRERTIPVLRRRNLIVDFTTNGREALALFRMTDYSLIIIHFPPSQVALEELLEGLRATDSYCCEAGVFLLAEQDNLEAARKYLGNGVDRVVNVAWQASELQMAVAMFLRLASRSDYRVLVELRLVLNNGEDSEQCSTANISTSGMFVCSSLLYPIGSRIRFELNLPARRQPLCGEAEVVRHVTCPLEGDLGIGVRFTSFEGDGRAQLRSFLGRLSGDEVKG